MGGDTDTNCCIVGSVCEALFGMNDIEKKEAFNNLPDNYQNIKKSL